MERDGAGRGSAPLVVLEGVTKRFPGVVANDDVSLELRAGEIHALVGENGAGKSTLMRVLYGIYPADGGRILVHGNELKLSSPRVAIANGIGMVHQHFVLVDPFTVTENIILGDEGGRRLDLAAANERISALAESFGFSVDPSATVEDLSVGEEQRVEILKALYRGVEILILDEPTAVLTPQETRELFGNLLRLRESGKTIVFISHKLDEVLEIADRITVLRRGKVVGETTPAQTSKEELAEMMVGRPVLFRLDKPTVELGEPILQVQGLTGGRLHGIDLEVRAGEIVGVAGVEGNGQRELAEALVGLTPPVEGRVLLEGKDIAGWSVDQVRDSGVAFIPEDRHEQGLVLAMSLWENAVLGRQDDARVLRAPRALDQQDQGAGRRSHPALRCACAKHQRQRRHAIGRQSTEADPRARTGDRPEAPRRRATHPRAGCRRDRVRLEADPRAEGTGPCRPADLGGAG